MVKMMGNPDWRSAEGLSATRAPVVLRAAAPESRFGFALSSAGDVNADGYQVFTFFSL